MDVFGLFKVLLWLLGDPLDTTTDPPPDPSRTKVPIGV